MWPADRITYRITSFLYYRDDISCTKFQVEPKCHNYSEFNIFIYHKKIIYKSGIIILSEFTITRGN